MSGVLVALGKSLNLKLLDFLKFTRIVVLVVSNGSAFHYKVERSAQKPYCQFKTQQPLGCLKLQRKTLQAVVKEENFFGERRQTV